MANYLTKKNLKFFFPFVAVFIISLLAMWFFHLDRQTIQQAVDVPVRVEKKFNPNEFDVARPKPEQKAKE